MKRKFIATALSVVLLAAGTPYAFSTGIPTLDVATGLILQNNAMAQAKQALDALKAAKDGIQQAKEQYDDYKSVVTGNDKLGNFLNNPALNRVMPVGDWSKIYTDVKGLANLRDRYGLKSDSAKVQEAFDKVLSVAGALEQAYEASNERVTNAEQLRAQLNQANTPQQKDDLNLRYQQELLEQQNQQMRLENMQMLIAQKEKIENKQRAQAFKRYLNGDGSNIPKYE
jgi:type IV secretion system protein VirB5